MTTRIFLQILMFFITCSGLSHAAESIRERLLMDQGWRFYVGSPEIGGTTVATAGLSVDISHSFGAFSKAGRVGGPAEHDFNDLGWRRVNLPHDWAVEMPFSNKADCTHGSKTVGPEFPESSVGWYRRSFPIPASDDGRRITIEFDGIFRDSEVFINGHYLGRNFSGYVPVSYDLSSYLTYGGNNTVAVKVNATAFEGWFYEGAGIYRHVWLTKTGPAHIPQFGTYLTSSVIGNPAKPTSATILARTTVRNDANTPTTVTVPIRLLDHLGVVVTTGTSTSVIIAPWSEVEITTTMEVTSPHLWSVDDPYLYQVETNVHNAYGPVDLITTAFGIRTIRYDANQGFFLNGTRIFMKGTCNHQDHAGVGVALPDRVNVWRIEQLKAMGCNAYRSSHNPPTPELLDACDRLGMLVMDETRMVGATEEALSQLDRMIRRDRNHPSIVIWNLGNEEMSIQENTIGARILAPMQRLAKKLDPSRPTTIAMNAGWGHGFSDVVDVQGGNYLKLGGGFDAFHKNNPQQPVLGSEEASHTTTRGSYTQDDELLYCHSDETKAKFPNWGVTAETWINYYAQRPYLCGGFVWTGFDYRGEPLPYLRWPSISSHFGILDTCGFPKDLYYYYQAWWTIKPVLHLQPHWNWPNRIGQAIDVRCDGNAEEVEIFVNGASQGRKQMQHLGHLTWSVIYQPGTLSAKGFMGGVQVSSSAIDTTDAPAAVRITPDRSTINADGEDVSMITVAVVDGKGRVVPTANVPVSFVFTGPGKILGVGNGNPTCHEPDQFIQSAPNVIIPKNWVAQVVNGPLNNVTSITNDDTNWQKAAFDGKTLTAKGQIGIWRSELNIKPEQLVSQDITLDGGKANGQLELVWNGKSLPINNTINNTFAIQMPMVNAGKNILAVVVTATGNKGGGLIKAPRLLLHSKATLPWQRSTFNGLAQIIVQSTSTSGELILQASAANLISGTTAITCAPASPRPAVP